MKKITDLKKQLAAISTESALLCITQKAGNKNFFWDGQLWTPNQAKEVWERYLLQMPCGDFGVVRFFGGPPGSGQWYDGTLLSMLCDLVLFEENTKHLTASEKLGA